MLDLFATCDAIAALARFSGTPEVDRLVEAFRLDAVEHVQKTTKGVLAFGVRSDAIGLVANLMFEIVDQKGEARANIGVFFTDPLPDGSILDPIGGRLRSLRSRVDLPGYAHRFEHDGISLIALLTNRPSKLTSISNVL